MKSGRFWFSLRDGAAAHLVMGPKAEMLCRAAVGGLPVPDGVVLRHEGWQQHGQIISGPRDSRWRVEALRALEALGLPEIAEEIAVRSAFSSEDGDRQSMAGAFTTRLPVQRHSKTALLEALREVWTSAAASPDPVERRDVLLMRMVKPEVSGVAFTQKDFEDDWINYTDGLAAALVSGETPGQVVCLPKLRRFERPDQRHRTQAWHSRLSLLLKKVRAVFGEQDWDVEWADDGKTCWLIQIRPVTAPPFRDEIFTTANLKEIFPEVPSPFMASLMEESAFSVFDFYRELDPRLPRSRPFFRLFAGRPYLNLSLLTEMMRRWGLPSSVITRSLGGREREAPTPLRLFRLAANLPFFCRLFWTHLGAVKQAKRHLQEVQRQAELPTSNFGELLERCRNAYVSFVHSMFSLISAAAGPAGILERLNALGGHLREHETVTTRMHAHLEELRVLARRDEQIRESLRHGNVPLSPDFRPSWERFLERFGHRGHFETDFSRPRWKENSAAILQSLAGSPESERPQAPRGASGARFWTRPLWWYLRRFIRTREEVRHEAMRVFAQLRQKITSQSQHIGLRPETIWLLRASEIRQLDQGWLPDQRFVLNRERQLERFRKIKLAASLHTSDPNGAVLSEASLSGESSGESKNWKGTILVPGRIRGRAWVLEEPSSTLPEGFLPEKTILVAKSIDASWAPLFGLVAGVVVEIGGELSHGSILLREIGLPSITNLENITRSIQSGDPLHLHADEGRVIRVGKQGTPQVLSSFRS